MLLKTIKAVIKGANKSILHPWWKTQTHLRYYADWRGTGLEDFSSDCVVPVPVLYTYIGSPYHRVSRLFKMLQCGLDSDVLDMFYG